MKQTLLLMVLALGMSGITFAQKKEYKVESDGYEWYEIRSSNVFSYYGAEDISGKLIVPMEYDNVSYIADKNPISTGFLASKGGRNMAWFNRNGECIIPYTRYYTWIHKYDKDVFGTYYVVKKQNGGAICDRNGNEVLSLDVDGIDIWGIYNTTINGIEYFYISFDKDHSFGIADANGKIIVESESDPSDAIDLMKSRITTTNNPLANNRHDTLAECGPATKRKVATPQPSIVAQSSSKKTESVIEFKYPTYLDKGIMEGDIEEHIYTDIVSRNHYYIRFMFETLNNKIHVELLKNEQVLQDFDIRTSEATLRFDDVSMMIENTNIQISLIKNKRIQGESRYVNSVIWYNLKTDDKKIFGLVSGIPSYDDVMKYKGVDYEDQYQKLKSKLKEFAWGKNL